MMKRLFAIVLCLAMLLSYAVPAVSAAGTNTGNTDDIYLGDGATINEFNTEDSEESNSPVAGDTSGKVPECSCGSKADIADHADSCTLKNYYHGLSCQTAEKLYDQWESFPEDVRSYILQCLNECDHEKLAYLQSMINTDLSGKDSAQMGDAVIHVSGIPVGGSLTVVPMIQTRSTGTSAVEQKVEAALNAMDERPSTNQLFIWDISVQDSNGNQWQPYSKPVTVEVALPDVELHPYTGVLIVHVRDDGETETISATVTERGTISFETKGFSTFAGFTVDFQYEDAKFSIDGLSEITLTDLFEHLRVPLYVSDVANVEFSDTSLISVTKIEGDWLLTSLKAFNTTESLTITLNNGTVHKIKVTDAYLRIKVS